MQDAQELALVVKALTCTLSHCVLWKDDRTERRIRADRELQGLTPNGIKALVREFVRSGGTIGQIREMRPEYVDGFDFYFKAVISVEDLPLPLFVEMVLTDDDPDCPVVMIVNAHLQRG